MTAFSALLAATAFAGSAFAGEEIYIATVCDDLGVYGDATGSCQFPNTLGIATTATGIGSALESFYLSGKEYQFGHLNTDPAYDAVPTIPTFALGETFSAAPASGGKDDPCYVNADATFNKAALIPAGRNGAFNWTVVLPKAPLSGLNLQLQCAVLKPNTDDITVCAGEEGEIIGQGFCTQQQPQPGVSPIRITALPIITATAYPGKESREFNAWAPFNLTAYKVPSDFVLTGPNPMTDSGSLQALRPSANSRIPLKACVTENIYVKQPVQGQVNALGQVEQDLVEGDYVVLSMNLPRGHTMDVYCHAQSARIAGIGENTSLLP